jgi:hypothetical protein
VSVDEIAEALEKIDPAEESEIQSGKDRIHIHATQELLRPYDFEEYKDENGKLQRKKNEDISAKTELVSPNEMSIVETVASFFELEFGRDERDVLKPHIQLFKKNMISNQRKSRQEAVAVLVSAVQQEAIETKKIERALTQA